MIFRLIDWYLRRHGYRRVQASAQFDWVPTPILALTEEALLLVEIEDTKPQGGEYKRHQVYAQLIKRHPESRKRDIGWAVERAVRRFHGERRNT